MPLGLSFGKQPIERRTNTVLLDVVTPSASLAVTQDELRDLAGIFGQQSEEFFSTAIRGITSYVEKQAGLSLFTKTYRETHDVPPVEIELKRKPVTSITSVKYYPDIYSSFQTTIPAASYLLAGNRLLARDGAWPSHRGFQGFELVYVAGFGTTLASLPEEARLVIQSGVVFLYDNPDLLSAERFTRGMPKEFLELVVSLKRGRDLL